MARLFTIGYEGATVAALIDTLQAAGVAMLVDVRAVPLSRKPGFSKRALAAALFDARIGYRHLQRLGTPSEGRAAARRGDYETLEHVYRRHLQAADAQIEMAILFGLARAAPACLLCFERNPDQCHRSLLARELGGELAITNLFAAPGR